MCTLQVLIQDGYLLEGTLCKKTLGASGGSLVHVIFMEAGPEAARAFLSQCQYVANYWMLQHGFSIGIGDTVADGATMLVINQTINRVRCWRLASCNGRRVAVPFHRLLCSCRVLHLTSMCGLQQFCYASMHDAQQQASVSAAMGQL